MSASQPQTMVGSRLITDIRWVSSHQRRPRLVFAIEARAPPDPDATSRALFMDRTVVEGGMVRSANRHGIVAALIALFIAVFVFVPTADAAACAVELDPAHAAASIDDDDGDGPAGPGDHAICSHGHCHHGSTTLPSPTQPVAINAAVAPTPLHRSSEPLASRSPSGLERPPRA